MNPLLPPARDALTTIARKIDSLPRWWPRAVVSLAIFGSALWLYTSTATPGLIVGGGVESEAAQLQRSAYRLGIAHSTGYPLYTIIGYGAGQLAEVFNQNPYTWITYTSSIAGAIALVLFFQLALTIGNPPSALAATGLLAVTGTMWHLSTIAETQALHAICVIGVFWLMIVHLRRPQEFAPLAGMALLGGIGLANHRTIVISGAPAVLALGMTGAWRKLSRRQWLTLIALVVIPVLSYGYIFWRATDPHVVMGVRETWRPAYLPELGTGWLIDYVLGTELNFNIQYPWHDFGERLEFVVNTLRDQLTTAGLIAGAAGLALLGTTRKRAGILLAIYTAGWTFFLMSWRLDWKATIYYHALLVPFGVGLVYLASWPAEKLFPRLPPPFRAAVLGSLFSLPLFAFFLQTYDADHDPRDLSGDHRGNEYLAQMQTIPPNTTVFSGGWSTDSFILLEYMDTAGREDIVVAVACVDGDSACWMADVVDQANRRDRTVYISPRMRSLLGMHAEGFDLPRRGVALSGTGTEIFLQARPKNDPRLQAEADAADLQLQLPIAPEIDLHSLSVEPVPKGIRLRLYWQATASIEARYSTYTHLRYYGTECQWDDTVRLLSQDDSRDPVNGNYPTIFWESGEIVKDTYLIPWPDAPLPPQGTALTIGLTLYGERMQEYCLPLQGTDGYPVDFEALGVKVLP